MIHESDPNWWLVAMFVAGFLVGRYCEKGKK